MTHYRWIRRPVPYTSVKFIDNSKKTQQSYIETKKKQAIVDYTSTLEGGVNYNACSSAKKPCYKDCFNNIINPPDVGDPSKTRYIPSSEYISNLVASCTSTAKDKEVYNTSNTPFAC